MAHCVNCKRLAEARLEALAREEERKGPSKEPVVFTARLPIQAGVVDQDGDVFTEKAVRQLAEAPQYRKNPVILWQHNIHHPPVGQVTEVELKDGAVLITGRLHPDFVTDILEHIPPSMAVVANPGFTVVGFKAMDSDGKPGRVYEDVELQEVSFILVPKEEALAQGMEPINTEEPGYGVECDEEGYRQGR